MDNRKKRVRCRGGNVLSELPLMLAMVVMCMTVSSLILNYTAIWEIGLTNPWHEVVSMVVRLTSSGESWPIYISLGSFVGSAGLLVLYVSNPSQGRTDP